MTVSGRKRCAPETLATGGLADMLDPLVLSGKARARLDGLAETGGLDALAVHELYRQLANAARPSAATPPMGPLPSPDGALTLRFGAEEWAASRWVHAPRVSAAATGEVLLDLWGTDWDAATAWAWVGRDVLRLFLRRCSKLVACVAVVHFGVGTFRIGGEGRPDAPLGGFRAACSATIRMVAGVNQDGDRRG